MGRKIIVRILAVLFVVLAGLSLWDFVYSLVNPSPVAGEIVIDAMDLLAIILLVDAGVELFWLKESGRKLSIFLLSIKAVSILVYLAWSLPIFLTHKDESFVLWYEYLGTKTSLINATGPLLAYLLLAAQFLIVVLLIVFLLLKKTRSMFSGRMSVPTEPAT